MKIKWVGASKLSPDYSNKKRGVCDVNLRLEPKDANILLLLRSAVEQSLASYMKDFPSLGVILYLENPIINEDSLCIKVDDINQQQALITFIQSQYFKNALGQVGFKELEVSESVDLIIQRMNEPSSMEYARVSRIDSNEEKKVNENRVQVSGSVLVNSGLSAIGQTNQQITNNASAQQFSQHHYTP